MFGKVRSQFLLQPGKSNKVPKQEAPPFFYPNNSNIYRVIEPFFTIENEKDTTCSSGAE
jgi:hypothetical protein